MPKLIILGTSNAIPDERHENTHMALIGEERSVLIDCVNNPLVRLKQGGVDLFKLTDLIATHFHPDHVSGIPSFLMGSWLLGRRTSIDIHGLQATLERIERLMGDYEWNYWPNFFPTHFHPLPAEELTPVLSSDEFNIYASPVKHMIPTIGLRIEFPQTGKVLAYSCDTEPTEAVVRLAGGADILIHESTGASLGHSSAEQAGQIASQAEVGGLYLIHYRNEGNDPRDLVGQAGKSFPGSVQLAEDFMEIDL